MNTNNTLLTLTTVAVVFTGVANAANLDELHKPNLNSQVQEVTLQRADNEKPAYCTPVDARPECRPNEDCVCLAA